MGGKITPSRTERDTKNCCACLQKINQLENFFPAYLYVIEDVINLPLDNF